MLIKHNALFTIALFIFTSPAYAQVHESICTLETKPTVLKTIYETQIPEEPNEMIQIIPPTFQTVEKEITIKEAHFVGDELETKDLEIVIQKPYESLQVIPATYKTIYSTIIKSPEYTDYELLTKEEAEELVASGELKTSRNRLIKKFTPAITNTISTRVVDTPASTKPKSFPGQSVIITKTIVKQAASESNRGARVPAVTKVIKTSVLDKPASIRLVAFPTHYRRIERQVIVSPSSIECN